MNPRRHRRLFVFAFALSLVAAQWLLGRAPAGGSLCGASRCFAPALER